MTYISEMLILRRMRWEGWEFKTSFTYKVRLCLQKVNLNHLHKKSENKRYAQKTIKIPFILHYHRCYALKSSHNITVPWYQSLTKLFIFKKLGRVHWERACDHTATFLSCINTLRYSFPTAIKPLCFTKLLLLVFLITGRLYNKTPACMVSILSSAHRVSRDNQNHTLKTMFTVLRVLYTQSCFLMWLYYS